MIDSSNICLACGLCCDGTLIGFVQLGQEELPRLKEIMEIEDVNGQGFFLHPCDKYCNGCTIYSERPKHCASFKCGLLKSVEQKELGFESATEIINVVKQKKIAIERQLAILKINLKSQSFYFKMVELKKWLHKNTSAAASTQDHLELTSELNQLDSLLSEKFNLSLN
ncbi:YkgJ family cysteine cluster protein [Pontibacter sp. E15-1]|uniref:YkgJ family cysteine cluster protein n=1 Tax=Pontibacter sp. E15-1 TaxID=2919918 RepID=UPI001F4F778F|nr:YkgJ family cysteine cluster protein [Pontibacter sp. E15-1]MCJ8167413.1 YkgJ family cysteine cluster protein [Pontibacter sp. E15-1]